MNTSYSDLWQNYQRESKYSKTCFQFSSCRYAGCIGFLRCLSIQIRGKLTMSSRLPGTFLVFQYPSASTKVHSPLSTSIQGLPVTFRVYQQLSLYFNVNQTPPGPKGLTVATNVFHCYSVASRVYQHSQGHSTSPRFYQQLPMSFTVIK